MCGGRCGGLKLRSCWTVTLICVDLSIAGGMLSRTVLYPAQSSASLSKHVKPRLAFSGRVKDQYCTELERQCLAPKKPNGGPTPCTPRSRRSPTAKSLPTGISPFFSANVCTHQVHAKRNQVTKQVTDAWDTTAQRPRQVGVCLKSLPNAETGSHFHSGNVPWQRVINAKGMISHRYVKPALPLLQNMRILS